MLVPEKINEQRKLNCLDFLPDDATGRDIVPPDSDSSLAWSILVPDEFVLDLSLRFLSMFELSQDGQIL